MAYADFKILNDFSYLTKTATLQQKVDLFNAATRGALVLQSRPVTGVFEDEVYWSEIAGLVARRDFTSTATATAVELGQSQETAVRVGARTPPIAAAPHLFNLIQQDPKTAGVIIGKQLAIGELRDMVNTAISALVAATGVAAGTKYDYSATGALDQLALNTGSALMGDQADNLRCWIMHSKSRHALYANALGNTAKLFEYGTVAVNQDYLGRVFIATDSPSLVLAGSPTKYYTLGLMENAAVVTSQPDFLQNVVTANGQENIQMTIQSQWSYFLRLKGYTWDKANGGASPSNAALATGSNWDATYNDVKASAGIQILTQ